MLLGATIRTMSPQRLEVENDNMPNAPIKAKAKAKRKRGKEDEVRKSGNI